MIKENVPFLRDVFFYFSVSFNDGGGVQRAHRAA
jgi:hypothetical protein